MTTEEKAKAYDEAIEKAKEIKGKILQSHLSTESCKAISEYIDTIIPELAESEDERIRKWLIDYFEKVNDEIIEKDRTRIISYLEKQKENIEKEYVFEYVFRPLAGTDITIAAEQAIRRAKEGHHLVLAFNGAYIPVRKGDNLNSLVDTYYAYLEKQKEQKPVEIHIDNPNIEKFDPDVKITTSDSSADGKELLYVSNKSYNIGYRDGVNSVKSAEWSEEDKKLKEELFELISVGIEGEDNRQNYYNFLDTHLHPQPNTVSIKDATKFGNLEYERGVKDGFKRRWKPTEEQMKALKVSVDRLIMQYPGYEIVLKSLYDDLKKLM